MVSGALSAILGDSGAKAILFYVGELDPKTFEGKLRAVLGEGSSIIINEIKKRQDAEPSAHKHHFFGGRGNSFSHVAFGLKTNLRWM